VTADTETEPLWQTEAACRGLDPDLFFPVRDASATEAKAVCATCPVAAECLEFALANGEHFGIWGGVPERQRRTMRRDGPQAAVLCAVLRGATTTAEVARRTHYGRSQAYAILCQLQDRGLVDWETSASRAGQKSGTIHAL
jgi:WhiB family redox-sensing transcriptional regulator